MFQFHNASVDTGRAAIANIRTSIRTKQELLTELAGRLAFPAYVGRNWDALSDALRDLSWIDRTSVMILHRDVPQLPDKDLRIYLDVLNESMESWKPGDAHTLIVIFPEDSEQEVRSYLQPDVANRVA